MNYETNIIPSDTKSICVRTTDIPIGPIEIKMRKIVSSLKGSTYTDQFEWSVYDRIAARLPDEPRGGVVFNTTFKLVNHQTSCSKCHYSFEVDTYGRGCFHNCEYCYAKDQLLSHGYWNNPQPFPVNLAEIRKIFYKVFETEKASQWRDVLSQRIPLRIGSMSDSFMLIDKKYGVTKELLRILSHYKYPYVIFTRSPLVADDEYLKLLDPKLCAVQFSVTGNNQAVLKKLEPQAPSYKSRLAAMEKLSKNQIWTTARLNPLFPKFPDGYFTDPDYINKTFQNRKNAPIFDLYNDEFMSEISDTGTPTILVGFVRMTLTAINRVSKATGIDFQKFFRPELFSKTGFSESRFSDMEINYYYQLLRKQAESNKMRFSTCYIGNGIKDYFRYQNLWSNKTDCCDVVGNVSNFTKTSQDIPWEIRQKHASNKESAEKTRKLELQFELEAKAPNLFQHQIPNRQPST